MKTYLGQNPVKVMRELGIEKYKTISPETLDELEKYCDELISGQIPEIVYQNGYKRIYEGDKFIGLTRID